MSLKTWIIKKSLSKYEDPEEMSKLIGDKPMSPEAKQWVKHTLIIIIGLIASELGTDLKDGMLSAHEIQHCLALVGSALATAVVNSPFLNSGDSKDQDPPVNG